VENKIELSIIIPCHNLENHIDKCLDSILQQDIADIRCEIIFICDSCSDNTEEKIVKKMNSLDAMEWHWKVRKVNYKSPGLTRNEGMSLAKGEYIWFIDGDDWLIGDNAIEVIIDLFRDNPSTDVVRFRFDSQGCPNKGIYITLWQYVFKREFIKDIKFQGGLFDEDVAFVQEVRSRSPKIKRIYDYFYWYNFPREGSLTEQKLIKKKGG